MLIPSISLSRVLKDKKVFVVSAISSNFFFGFDLKLIPLGEAELMLSFSLLMYLLETDNSLSSVL